MAGVWSIQGFRGEVSRTFCPSLLDKIPNFAIAATEAVIQSRNTQWGKSLQSNGNKTAFSPEVNISLQVLVDVSSSVCEGASSTLTPFGICPAMSSLLCDRSRPWSQQPSVGHRDLAALKEPLNCLWVMVENHLNVAMKRWAEEKTLQGHGSDSSSHSHPSGTQAGETICKTTDSILRM